MNLSGLRDDVDHSVEGVEAVDDRGGPFQHLDAFNLREGDRKRFPEHQALSVDVDGATVHHHEEFVGEQLVVASCADIKIGACDLHHIQPGHAAENGRDVGGAGLADIRYCCYDMAPGVARQLADCPRRFSRTLARPFPPGGRRAMQQSG